MSFWLRKQVLVIIATIFVAFSNVIYALGLGEATVITKLYEPLKAEISLQDVAGVNAGNISVKLASHDDFRRVGIDYQYVLAELKFRVVFDKSGKRYIEITTDKPMRESYLHFLIEVNAPNKSGKSKQSFLREYTLLLDAPLYDTSSTVEAVKNPPLTKTSPSIAKEPLESDVTTKRKVARKSSAPISGNQYNTVSGDTLWEIALRMGAGKNAHQAMLAIVELNPNAFIGGNVNLVKAGFVLRLPDQSRINQINRETALATVQEHNRTWRSGGVVASSKTKSLDATVRTKAGDAPRTTDKDGLRLVANGSSAMQEQLKSTLDENNELKSRLDSLQTQIDQLERLTKLKDEQLAELQQSLAQQNKNNNETATKIVDTPIITPDPIVNEKEKTTTQENQPPPKQTVITPPPPPVEEELSLVDQALNIVNDLLDNTMIMTAAGGLFLLVILGFAISKIMPILRRGRKTEEYDDELGLAELEMLEQAKASVVSSGALSEADSFIGYGQYNEAFEVLTKAIAEAPANTALRLKLLEVLAEQDNAQEFAAQEKQLLAIGGGEMAAQIYVIKQAYPNLNAENKENTANLATEEDPFAGLDDPFVNDVSLDGLDDFKMPQEPVAAEAERTETIDDVSLDLNVSEIDTNFADNPFETDVSFEASEVEETAEPIEDIASDDFNFDDNTSSAEENVDFGLSFDDIELETSAEDQLEQQIEEDITSADLASDELFAELDQETNNDNELNLDDLSEDLTDISFDLEDTTQVETIEDEDSNLDFSDEIDLTEEEPGLNLETESELDFDLNQEESATSFDPSDDGLINLDETDEIATKFELAEAYIEMGDSDGAREILEEIIKEGDPEQQDKAQALIDDL